MTLLFRDFLNQICFGFEVMMQFVDGGRVEFQGAVEVDGEMFDTETRSREACVGRILSLLHREDVEVGHEGPVLTISAEDAATIRVPPGDWEAWHVTLPDGSGVLCDSGGKVVRFKRQF